MKFLSALFAFSISATSSGATEWVYFEEANPLTRELDFWSSFRAKSATAQTNYGTKYMTIFAACIEGQLDISVNVEEYLGRGQIGVRYRVDEANIVSEQWRASADGTGVFVPRNFKDFRKGLQDGNTLAFGTVDYRGASYTTVFEGLDQGRANLTKVLTNCEAK